MIKGSAVLPLLAICLGGCRDQLPRELSQNEVKALAFQALTPSEKGAPGLGYEIDERRDPRYAGVTVTWSPPPDAEGSVVVVNFDVDKITGDVWTTSACSARTNPDLTALQARLRQQRGITVARYRELKNDGPLCDK